MPDPENMTLVLLREMRGRMEERFDKVDQRLIAHDARFDALEKKIDDVKRAAFGESLFGR